jgi:hypothetical protein
MILGKFLPHNPLVVHAKVDSCARLRLQLGALGDL